MFNLSFCVAAGALSPFLCSRSRSLSLVLSLSLSLSQSILAAYPHLSTLTTLTKHEGEQEGLVTSSGTTIAQLHDDIILLNYQNASVCCFIVLIKATVSLNLGGIDKF